MLKIDWAAPKPDPQEWQTKLVGELQITRRAVDPPAVAAVVDEINRTHVNGGALFAHFDLAPHPVLDWYGSRNRLEEIDFVDQFVRLSTMAAVWPEMLSEHKIQQRIVTEKAWPNILQWQTPFALDGELANLIYQGGAYERSRLTPGDAKRLAGAFCAALFGERYDEVWVCRSPNPWTSWFYGIAWDITYFGFDKRERAAWFLCVTDTD